MYPHTVNVPGTFLEHTAPHPDACAPRRAVRVLGAALALRARVRSGRERRQLEGPREARHRSSRRAGVLPPRSRAAGRRHAGQDTLPAMWETSHTKVCLPPRSRAACRPGKPGQQRAGDPPAGLSALPGLHSGARPRRGSRGGQRGAQQSASLCLLGEACVQSLLSPFRVSRQVARAAPVARGRRAAQGRSNRRVVDCARGSCVTPSRCAAARVPARSAGQRLLNRRR